MTKSTSLGNPSSEGVSLIDLASQAIRYWWVAAACMVLGAVLALGFGRLRPPVYEARASLPTTIDFTGTGKLTQFEEDLAMDAIGAILKSSAVIDESAGQLGLAPADLRERVTVERRLGEWEVRARAGAPEEAAKIANTWMSIADAKAREGYGHAVTAEQLALRAQALEACLAQSVSLTPAQPLCAEGERPTLQADLASVGQQLAAEKLASNGVIASVLLSEMTRAEAPTKPLLNQTGLLAFAGALIGLCAAVGWLLSGAPIPGRRGDHA